MLTALIHRKGIRPVFISRAVSNIISAAAQSSSLSEATAPFTKSLVEWKACLPMVTGSM